MSLTRSEARRRERKRRKSADVLETSIEADSIPLHSSCLPVQNIQEMAIPAETHVLWTEPGSSRDSVSDQMQPAVVIQQLAEMLLLIVFVTYA